MKPLGVPTQRIALTLLLSLRFMSLVFEEVRNLCLGLAARGVDWRAQGGRGSMEILGRLVVRLFGNLFQRSEKISQVGHPVCIGKGGGPWFWWCVLFTCSNKALEWSHLAQSWFLQFGRTSGLCACAESGTFYVCMWLPGASAVLELEQYY